MYSIPLPHAAKGKIEFLSFQLGGNDYGIEFRKVKELCSLASMERFASDGAIISGVAASHGVIMPIVDMREAFPKSRLRDVSRATDVIILQLSSCVMGMVVDGVTDVVRVHTHQITPIPGAGASDCDYLLGLGEADGRRLILVDIDKLMSIKRDVQALDQAVA